MVTNTKSRTNNNHKLLTSLSLPVSMPLQAKDAAPATRLLIKLMKSNSKPPPQPPTTQAPPLQQQQQQLQQPSLPPVLVNNNVNVEMRDLECWNDVDELPVDESSYQELVDPSNSNGWAADEMFRYNERKHKIMSSYNEQTLSENYTTPLPKNKSKNITRLAAQIAKKIEEKVLAEGRITPESSDDDELFEKERERRKSQGPIQKRQQQDQVKQLFQRQQQKHLFSLMNTIKTNTTQSSSQYSNSTETPATVSLSSSPTLNDAVMRPIISSSRNILRTCLTLG